MQEFHPDFVIPFKNMALLVIPLKIITEYIKKQEE